MIITKDRLVVKENLRIPDPRAKLTEPGLAQLGNERSRRSMVRTLRLGLGCPLTSEAFVEFPEGIIGGIEVRRE